MLHRLREFDEREGWGPLGFTSCARWLSWRTGMSPTAARERVRVARALGELDALAHAFERGELSYSKVRAITRVATPANVDGFIELGRVSTADQLDRVCRAHATAGAEAQPEPRFVRRRDRDGGMVRIEIQLPREEADVVWEAISAVTQPPAAEPENAPAEAPADSTAPANDPAPAEERRADAVVALAEASLQAPKSQSRGSSFELLLVTSPDALRDHRDGAGGLFLDGAPLQGEPARMIACDCAKTEATLDAAGNPLSIGRRTRVIPPHLHKALRLRDGGCAFPGCPCRRHVDGHHIKHWADGGETALDNLVYLCRRHHTAVHQGRIAVELVEGRPRFWTQEGREIPRVAEPVSDVSLEPLEGVECLEPLWEGDPLDLDAALFTLPPPSKRSA